MFALSPPSHVGLGSSPRRLPLANLLCACANYGVCWLPGLMWLALQPPEHAGGRGWAGVGVGGREDGREWAWVAEGGRGWA